MPQTKKAKLKEALKTTLSLVLECYPDLRGMLKKDLTIDDMANDIMTSLEEFTPEKMQELKGASKKELAKRVKELSKKLRLK